MPDDAPAVEPWLAEAVAAVDGVRPGPETPATLAALARLGDRRWSGGTLLVLVAAGQGVVGLLGWRPLATAGGAATAAVIDALAVRRDRRDLGYGVEAVERLEAMLSAATVYATPPRTNGLALYFWLRAGYRPFYPNPAAAAAMHGLDPALLWMVRELG